MNDEFYKPFDYSIQKYIDPKGTEEFGFKIDEGEFEGVIFSVHSIKFNENDHKTECTMSFDYELYGEVKHKVNDNSVDRFEKAVGDLILYVLYESMKVGELSKFLGDK